MDSITESRRIVLVLPGFPREPIGGYKVVYAYANVLASRGHDVTICQSLLLKGGIPGGLTPRLLAAGLRSGLRRSRRPNWFELDHRVVVRNTVALSAQSLPPADFVVATAAHTAPLVAEACRLRGSSGSYFIQHFEDWAAPRDFVVQTWQLPLRRIVIADWLAQVGRDLGVETLLVPNAIDGDEFPEGPPTRERALDVVAMVSTHAWKRTDLVIEAFRRLKEMHPQLRGATFGTGGRPEGLPEFVEHHESPTKAELVELYQQARVYLCASDGEGWHLPPAEAMSSGAAVVSTDIPGVSGYAKHSALFSPVGDLEGLVTNLNQLISSPGECQALAQLGCRTMRGYTPLQAAAAFESAILGSGAR